MFILTRTTPNGLKVVLCQSGEFCSAQYVGNRVGMTAKTWKTEAGAMRFASDRWNSSNTAQSNLYRVHAEAM